MKVQIKAFVCYEKPWRDGDSGFCVQSFDPTPYGHERILVCEQTFEVDVPDNFDPRPQMVKALEAQKEKARKEFAATVMRIDKQINELLALEHSA